MNMNKWLGAAVGIVLCALAPAITTAQAGGDQEICIPNDTREQCKPPVFAAGPNEYFLYTNSPDGFATKEIIVTATDVPDGSITPVCSTLPEQIAAHTYTYENRDYSMNCRATDSHGNFATKLIYIGVGLDTGAPTITAPADESFVTSSFPFTPAMTQAEAADPVDGEGVSSGIASITASMTSFSAAGTFAITWTATDNAGNTATATSNVTITFEGAEEENFDIEADISLPNGCEVIDADGTRHIFPTATTTQHLAICALVEAVEQNIISGFEVSNHPALGLSLETLNGVAYGDEQYWATYRNGEYGGCGIGCLSLQSDDVLRFVLTSYSNEELPYELELRVTETLDTYNNVIVPNICTVQDVEGNSHTYPTTDSTDTYLTVCALRAALDEGYIEDIDFSDSEHGLFLDNFNDIQKPDGAYWDFRVNGVSADWGVVIQEVEVGDTLSFILSVWNGGPVAVEPRQEINLRVIDLLEVVEEDEEPTPGGGGNTGGGTPAAQFSVPQALAYLSAQQGPDGAIVNVAFSDWAAIAFAAQDPGNAKTMLRTYLLSNPAAGTEVTDYERRAMALMALGINPYSGTATNYIAPIVAAFDGTQIGQSFVQDDIFAIFPLLKAGYSVHDEIIQKAVAYIISKQIAGSWGDPDSTAAAVQALSLVPSLPGVADSLAQAKTYLHTQQQSNGGFSNISSTSWVMQAIAAFNESSSSWTVASKTPIDYLATTQQLDGGVTDASTPTSSLRVWATTYAIPGALGKTWDSLLTSFAKPTTGGSNPSTPAATTTIPVAQVATSTPAVATSTIAIAPVVAEVQTQGQVLGAATVNDTQATTTIIVAQNTRVTEIPEVTPDTVDETATTTIETTVVDTSESADTDADGMNPWWIVLVAFFALLLFGIAYQFWYARNR